MRFAAPTVVHGAKLVLSPTSPSTPQTNRCGVKVHTSSFTLTTSSGGVLAKTVEMQRLRALTKQLSSERLLTPPKTVAPSLLYAPLPNATINASKTRPTSASPTRSRAVSARQRQVSQKHTPVTSEDESARVQRRDELRALNQIMCKLEEVQFEEAMRSLAGQGSAQQQQLSSSDMIEEREMQRLHCLSPVAAVQMSV